MFKGWGGVKTYFAIMEESCWVFIWDGWESWVRSQGGGGGGWGEGGGRGGGVWKTWEPVWRHSTPAFELPRQLLRMKLYPLFHCCHVVIVVVEGKMGEKKIYFTHQCGPYLTITSIKMREKDREICCLRWEKFLSPTSMGWQKVEQHN